MTTVVDASFAVNWAIGVQSFDVDQRLIAAEEEGDLIAPVIFWHEVASALRSLSFRSILSKNERNDALIRLNGLNVVLDYQLPPIGRVVDVSDRFSLTIYDAAYLEFALRVGAALATDDAALITSAGRSNLRVIRSA